MDRKLLIYFYILVIILLGTLGYFGGWWDGLFTKKEIPTPTTPTQPLTPEMNVFQTKLTGWDEQKKAWEIEASRIWQTNNGSIIYFEDISNGIIFSVDDKTVKFTAKWARFEKWRRMLFFGGDFEAYMDDKIFTTKEGVMDYKKQEILCDSEIKVKGDNLSISAGKLKIYLEQEEFLLEKNVELIQDNDRVNAQGIKYNLKTEEFELIEPEGVILNL